jgi:predicted dithiol-disulfide oxidoreductase (DUF899 family)
MLSDKQIKLAINEEWKAIERYKLLYDKRVQRHKDKIKEIRKQCPHSEESYYPDPSGNNDSTYTCDVCGRDR